MSAIAQHPAHPIPVLLEQSQRRNTVQRTPFAPSGKRRRLCFTFLVELSAAEQVEAARLDRKAHRLPRRRAGPGNDARLGPQLGARVVRVQVVEVDCRGRGAPLNPRQKESSLWRCLQCSSTGRRGRLLQSISRGRHRRPSRRRQRNRLQVKNGYVAHLRLKGGSERATRAPPADSLYAAAVPADLDTDALSGRARHH
jgi:hypothetical protein